MIMTNWFHRLLDLCYPGVCVACGATFQGAGPLCNGCTSELETLEQHPACRCCAMPLNEDLAPCPYCLGKGVPHYERIVRLGSFGEPLKGLIHQIKYHRRWPAAEQLADRLIALERVKGLLSETQCLVAVPLHRWRQIGRGYNQADIIARRISKVCHIPLAHPIRRVRATESQTALHSHDARERNVHNAFVLTRPASIQGRHVVVVDDVMTSGATLQAVARTLLPAKPASLSVMVLAVADPKARDFQSI